ncbi:MAG TPA: hypothetical protein VM821_02535, partial [Abditibacteriaceae bacterium]|nr:hypothetical protein [Abditibacteriaceae bacterium]
GGRQRSGDTQKSGDFPALRRGAKLHENKILVRELALSMASTRFISKHLAATITLCSFWVANRSPISAQFQNRMQSSTRLRPRHQLR